MWESPHGKPLWRITPLLHLGRCTIIANIDANNHDQSIEEYKILSQKLFSTLSTSANKHDQSIKEYKILSQKSISTS